MRHAPAVTALLLAGCGAGASDLPVQEPAQVVAAFSSAIAACTGALTGRGAVDTAALTRAGWQVTERTVSGDNRAEPGGGNALDGWQAEVTTLLRGDAPNRLFLTRYGATDGSLHERCAIDARVRRGQVEPLVATLTARIGRAPDRVGEQPRGGDFLTPRFDQPWLARYWQLPRHDLYLATKGRRFVRVEIVAMADRTSLDRFSPDRPEARIPIEEGPE